MISTSTTHQLEVPSNIKSILIHFSKPRNCHNSHGPSSPSLSPVTCEHSLFRSVLEASIIPAILGGDNTQVIMKIWHKIASIDQQQSSHGAIYFCFVLWCEQRPLIGPCLPPRPISGPLYGHLVLAGLGLGLGHDCESGVWWPLHRHSLMYFFFCVCDIFAVISKFSILCRFLSLLSIFLLLSKM